MVQVADIEMRLDRTLGAGISVTSSLAPGLRPVGVERTAREQILVNLAVNARDAMPDGGARRALRGMG